MPTAGKRTTPNPFDALPGELLTDILLLASADPPGDYATDPSSIEHQQDSDQSFVRTSYQHLSPFSTLRAACLVSKAFVAPTQRLLLATLELNTTAQCHSFMNSNAKNVGFVKELDLGYKTDEREEDRRWRVIRKGPMKLKSQEVEQIIAFCASEGSLRSITVQNTRAFSFRWLESCSTVSNTPDFPRQLLSHSPVRITQTLESLSVIGTAIIPSPDCLLPPSLPSLQAVVLKPPPLMDRATSQAMQLFFRHTHLPQLHSIEFLPRYTYPSQCRPPPIHHPGNLPDLRILSITPSHTTRTTIPFEYNKETCLIDYHLDAERPFNELPPPDFAPRFTITLNKTFYWGPTSDATCELCPGWTSPSLHEQKCLKEIERWFSDLEENENWDRTMKIKGEWDQVSADFVVDTAWRKWKVKVVFLDEPKVEGWMD